MSLGTILLIILVIALLGALAGSEAVASTGPATTAAAGSASYSLSWHLPVAREEPSLLSLVVPVVTRMSFAKAVTSRRSKPWPPSGLGLLVSGRSHRRSPNVGLYHLNHGLVLLSCRSHSSQDYTH